VIYISIEAMPEVHPEWHAIFVEGQRVEARLRGDAAQIATSILVDDMLYQPSDEGWMDRHAALAVAIRNAQERMSLTG